MSAVDGGRRADPWYDLAWGEQPRHAVVWDEPREQSRVGLIPGLLSDRLRHSVLAGIGVLFSFRTVTGEQLAALTGDARYTQPRSRLVADLRRAHLVQMGKIRETFAGQQLVFRLGAEASFNELLARLTPGELMAVTGGLSWRAPTHYDRHNVLATELGLRLAEYSMWTAGVLGERFATFDHLAGRGVGLEPVPANGRGADLVIVGVDGRRVAIELTTNVNRRLREKAAAWTRLMQQTSLERSGLTVVFLVVTPDDGDRNGMRSAVYGALKRATLQFPGHLGDRTAERIGVATWHEYFPAAHVVSEAFTLLTADRPTGRASALWESCDFLVQGDTDRHALAAAIDSIAGLGGSPHWLKPRTAQAPASYPIQPGLTEALPEVLQRRTDDPLGRRSRNWAPIQQ